ncbi:hypothetical protein ACEUCJ_21125 [Aeromonas rivipollensis]|uniref:hypothetical protein n=1 Tax=Aeromonas rivipollensis TaxID=948519 RepID=UPI0038CFB4FB
MKVRDQKTKAMLKALKENPNVALSPAEQIIEFERKLDGIGQRIASGEHVTDEELSFLEDVLEAERKILSEI